MKLTVGKTEIMRGKRNSGAGTPFCPNPGPSPDPSYVHEEEFRGCFGRGSQQSQSSHEAEMNSYLGEVEKTMGPHDDL